MTSDHERNALSEISLTTATAAPHDAEGADPEDDLALQMTTTFTESSGESEGDPEDSIYSFSAITNVTKVGPVDPQADPEDDDNAAGPTSGTARPLLYRFAEAAVQDEKRFAYDAKLQLLVDSAGIPLVDRLRQRARSL